MDEIENILENPRDIYLFQLPGIQEDQILHVIRKKYNQKNSIQSIAKELHIRKTRLKSIFTVLKLPLKPHGRPKKPQNPEIIEKIVTTKTCFDVGYKHIKDSYFIDDKNVTYHDVYKNFQDQYLFTFHRKQKERHDNEYVAQYINQMWHTDLK